MEKLSREERFRATGLCHKYSAGCRRASTPQKNSSSSSASSPKRIPNALRSHQLLLLTRLILHDVSRHGARRDGQWRSEIHLSRPPATWEVTVLRADHDLISPRRNSRPGVNASAATGLDHVSAGLLKHFQISMPQAVLARLLRPKLNVEL